MYKVVGMQGVCQMPFQVTKQSMLILSKNFQTLGVETSYLINQG